MSANIYLNTIDEDLFTQADAYLDGADEVFYEEHDGGERYEYAYPPARFYPLDYVNSLTIVVFLLILVFVYGAISKPTTVASNRTQVQATAVPADVSASSQTQPKIDISGSPTAVQAPYTNYQITQGIHGASYGHMAIDLAAGRGEPVLSPINGVVTALYVDEYGNPTLQIENDVYLVTILHGDFTVQLGDSLRAGEQVGTESNKGYTMDMQGNLCYGREWCGNHTHLNIYDKRIGSNVNPLDLIGG